MDHVDFRYATQELMTKEDVLIYSFEILVGDLGGSLGLFLGFSFLGIVDLIQPVISVIKERFK